MERSSAKLEVPFHGHCANCCRELVAVPTWYWEYGGQIQYFCSPRCQDRFVADPVRRLIVSPLHEV